MRAHLQVGRRALLLAAVALVSVGCGGGSGGGGADGGRADGALDGGASDAARDGRTDGSAGQCTAEDFATRCPPRPCEVPSGCSADGVCQYEPFVCGVPGRACPVQRCVSSMEDGGIVNRCERVEGGACGEGGTCVGSRCVVDADGLRLVGELSVARSGATVGGLTLEGDLGTTPARHGPMVAGRLRLTGGLAPVADRVDDSMPPAP